MKEFLKKNPLCYVCRDIERAIGFDLDIPGYFVVSNFSDYISDEIKNKKNVFLVRSERILDTRELLAHPEVVDFISNRAKNILVFKNTAQIERICRANSWNLLNMEASLSSLIEGKTSEIDWSRELKSFLPNSKIVKCRDLLWEGEKFILQFNSSHSGEGTILIESDSQIREFRQKFPQREVKITEFLEEGEVFTNNNIILGREILIGNISYQITGLHPFTKNIFSTVGNDWSLANKILSDSQKKVYKKIVQLVAEILIKKNWQGLFGIDVLWSPKRQKFYLIEVNARQPASASFESRMQKQKNQTGLSVFEAHIQALMGLEAKKELTSINKGAQIIKRSAPGDEERREEFRQKLGNKGFSFYEYEKGKQNFDMFRVQSEEGFLQEPGKLNPKGQELAEIFK